MTVDTRELPWRETPHSGVRWKKVSFDGEASVVLLDFAPGASYEAHRHPGGESYFVISGSLRDGGRTYGEGTWVVHPPGSTHKPSSPEGCRLLVLLAAPIEPLGQS